MGDTMMDRKRNADEGIVAPPAKRHNSIKLDESIGGAVGATSSANKEIKFGPPDNPFRYDLDTYQKDALYRQWQQAKSEKKSVEKQLDQAAEENRQLKELMVKLDLALTQMIDEANVLTGDIEIQNAITYPEEDSPDDDEPESATTFASSLLKTNPDFRSSLVDERFAKMKELLKSIIVRIPKAYAPEVLKLQSQLARVAAAEKTHIEQYQKLTILLEENKKRAEDAEHDVSLAKIKISKASSQVKAYMEYQARIMGKSVEKEEKTNGEAVNGHSVENSAAINSVEAAKQSAIAETKKRAEQVESLEKENRKLKEDLSTMTVRMNSLTEDDYANTDLFKLLRSKYQDVVGKANDLEKLNSDLREDLQKMRSERTAYQNEIERESRDRTEELEAQIAKTLNEVQRLRQDRDNKFNEKVALELSQNKYETEILDLRKLHEAQTSQMKAMEHELERLELQLGKEPSVESEDQFDEEAIKKELKKYKGLYSVLEQEVESMSKTVIKFRDLAGPRTEQMRKAEQELEAVKHSRAKLQSKCLAHEVSLDAKRQEIQVLKNQIVKTSSVIASINESNSKHGDAAVINERLREELKAEISQLSIQNRELQQRANESKIQLDQARGEATSLAETLASKEKEISTAQSAVRTAEAKIEGIKADYDEQKKWIAGVLKSRGNPGEELEMLRKVAYCSVCNQNVKNTLLKTCSHTLCSKCADARVANRSRKCPICMKPFGVGDLMPVHFV